MFYAVQDGPIFFAEDNVAVLPHQFHNQTFPAHIAHLVQMFDGKFNDPFQAGLLHLDNPPGTDVLAQKHTEIGCGQGAWLIAAGKIGQREAGVGGNRQT